MNRLHVWEVPETLKYEHWSPFESVENFVHQLKYTVKTGLRIIDSIGSFDLLHFTLPTLLIVPLVIWAQKVHRFRTAWVAFTVFCYVSGFTLVWCQTRYYVPFLWPLVGTYVMTFVTAQGYRWFGKRRGIALGLLVFLSFAVPPVHSLYNHVQAMRSTDQNQQLQQLAEDLTVAGVVGPFAASKWDKGLYIAYHMSTPYLGVPTGSDVDAIVAQLEAAGAKSFLVDSQWDLLTAFHQQSDWTLKDVFKSGSLEIHVFEPQAEVQCAGY